MIQINGIDKKFGDNEVLKNIHFKIQRGDFITVMGQYGCGKSTLL